MSKKKTEISSKKIEIDQILLHHRQLFIFDKITSELANQINKTLIGLDRVNNKPIVLRINSEGGSLYAGFSIIDTMKTIKSPVITCIVGCACSMAGIISIAGDKRLMTKYSVWMAHDVSAYSEDYISKMIDYTEYLKENQKRVFEFLGRYTKLSQQELTKAKNGELWFFAKEAKRKGICDIVIE